jgi:hypothetical protein
MKFVSIIVAMSALLLACPTAAAAVQTVEGTVSEVQLIDTAGLDGPGFLILSLVEGGSYLLPDQQRVGAGRGVRVEVRFLPPDEPGDLPHACSIRVLALPVVVDGQEQLQYAQRPFSVFENADPACD